MSEEAKIEELKEVSEVVGNHKVVAEIIGVSPQYLCKLRRATKKDIKSYTSETFELIDKALSVYRSIGKGKISKLSEVVIKQEQI